MKKTICICDLCETEGAIEYKTYAQTKRDIGIGVMTNIEPVTVDLCEECAKKVFALTYINGEFYITRD